MKKVAAIQESAKAAVKVGLAAGSVVAVVMASLKPLGRQTQANVQRLSAKAMGGPGFAGGSNEAVTSARAGDHWGLVEGN